MTISQGGIDQITQRAGQHAVAAPPPLLQAVQANAVVNSDETSARVDGRNWWEWVFCTAAAILHVIKPSRGADVIQAVMGTQYAEIWGSDCWSAQLKAPAQGWQLCLAHQLRNLPAAVDRDPRLFWAQAMQALFRYAIHIHHQRDQLPAAQFAAQVARIATLCDWLLARPLTQPQARREQTTEAFTRKYRPRLGVEGTISQAVHAFELRTTRYFGFAKTHLPSVALVAAINLCRFVDYLAAAGLNSTRTSAFAALAPR